MAQQVVKAPPVDRPTRRNVHRGFEFFASPPDAPRVRRSSDTAVVVAGGALVAILAVVRGGGTSVDAVLIGLVAAAVIRVVFGTSAGVPSLARFRAGLGDLGISLASLEYVQDQPPSSTTLDGVTDHGSRSTCGCWIGTAGRAPCGREPGGRPGIRRPARSMGAADANRSSTRRSPTCSPVGAASTSSIWLRSARPRTMTPSSWSSARRPGSVSSIPTRSMTSCSARSGTRSSSSTRRG
jgi:hypothetical protein